MRNTRTAGLMGALGGAALVAFGACSAPFESSTATGTGGVTTSTSAQGGTAGRGAQGGAGGLGGSTTGAEDCTNGSDDDGDLLTDCADPDCIGAGYACLAVPGGFTGPVTTVAPVGTSCPASWEDTGVTAGSGISADPLGCDCACDPPSNVACASFTTINLFASAGCQLPSGSAAASTACANFLNGGGAVSMRVLPPALSGSCGVGTASTTTTPPVQMLEARSLCAASANNLGTGCAANAVCAPPTAAGPLCFYKVGVDGCPVGYAETVLYQSSNDQRSCGCDCTFGGSCSANVSVFNVSGCGGTVSSVPANGSCASTFNVASTKLETPTPAASCAEQASAHGSVTASEPLTLCCAPP